MRYEALKDRTGLKEWRVEAINIKEGDVHVTIFSGPLAKERAQEYADWKNGL